MGIAIRAEHLSKEYRLGVINHGMLYKDLQSWFARKIGKPDPHAQIGTEHFADQSDRFWALKDICFEIEEGDRIGIIGRNGAGKSTLLKVLSRITAPTEGIVGIKGRVTSLLEVGTGFHGELTGRENIYLNGAILGMKKREIDRKIDEIIDFAEMAMFIDTPVKRYSSGMYVRLAFSVAAHLDSEILIADEVLAVGDAVFQKRAVGKMSELSSGQGKTVLFVSHNLATVKQLCTKGMVLERGKSRPISSIEEAIRYYKKDDEKRTLTDVSSYERNRTCSLRAKVIDYSVLSKNGENTGEIEAEEPLKIRLAVESYYDSLLVGMQLIVSHNEQNLILFDSGHMKNQLFSLNKGNYSIECSIEKLSLYAGNYSLSLGLSIPGTELVDFIPNAYSFTIPSFGPDTVGQIMHIDGGWGVYYPEHEYSCTKVERLVQK